MKVGNEDSDRISGIGFQPSNHLMNFRIDLSV